MIKLPVITLKKAFHKGNHQILIQFYYNESLIALTRKLNGALWSATKKSWYVKNTPENLKAIYVLYNGKAVIDRQYLFGNTDPRTKPKSIKRKRMLSEEQRTMLNNFVKYLKGKRYSKSTVSSYASLIADFVEFVKDKHISQASNKDVERFAEDILAPRNYSINTHRQFVSAIKIFRDFYPSCKIEKLELDRPKKSKILPVILSQEEVIDLLRFTKNLKHRAILGLIYSAGLRISELINLELRDINIDRRQLHIKNAKGRKDRYVVLSEGFLPLLQNYVVSYKPKRYFVEGTPGKCYSASSVRKFLNRSCIAAKIKKRITPHTLRHSYATHLLEQGVGLRHIQELLGHAKPETTMVYTQVAKKDLMEIRSPLDTILLSLAKSDKQEQNVLLSANNNL